MTGSRRAVSTPHAPKAIGPYSQAVVHGGLLWCSGQIALDPATGEMVGAGGGADAARRQTVRVLENLSAVLAAGGSSPAQVLRCTVYLADMEHFGAVNEEYAKYFGGAEPPARATVQAARLPRGALVEIDCVAAV